MFPETLSAYPEAYEEMEVSTRTRSGHFPVRLRQRLLYSAFTHYTQQKAFLSKTVERLLYADLRDNLLCSCKGGDDLRIAKCQRLRCIWVLVCIVKILRLLFSVYLVRKRTLPWLARGVLGGEMHHPDE